MYFLFLIRIISQIFDLYNCFVRKKIWSCQKIFCAIQDLLIITKRKNFKLFFLQNFSTVSQNVKNLNLQNFCLFQTFFCSFKDLLILMEAQKFQLFFQQKFSTHSQNFRKFKFSKLFCHVRLFFCTMKPQNF